MPTYDYKCQACGYEFEKFQSITANPLRSCPKCHKRRVKRLIGTGAGVIFKGSGFYQTDYRSDSYKKGAEKDTPAGDTADSSKADAKTKPSPETSSSDASASETTSGGKSGEKSDA